MKNFPHIHMIYKHPKTPFFDLFYRYFLLLLFTFLPIGIKSQNSYYWQETGMPFDTLFREIIQSKELLSRDTNRLWEIVGHLEKMSNANKTCDIMKVRTLFWKANLIGLSDVRKTDSLTQVALELVDTLTYRYDYYRLLELKGNLDLNIGNYYDSFVLYKKLIPFFSSIGDIEMETVCKGNLGLIYLFIDDFEEALYYLNQAKSGFYQQGQTDMCLLAEQQIAYIYEQTEKRDTALTLLRTVLDNYPENGELETKYYCLNSYLQLLPEGLEKDSCLNEAEKIAYDSNDWHCIVSALKNKAGWLYQKGEYEQAQHYAEEVLKKSDENVYSFGKEEDIYNLLADIYGKQKNWEKAYAHKMKAENLRDSIENRNSKERILKEKVQSEILNYSYRLKEMQYRQEQRRKLTWVVSVSSTLLLILLLIVIRLLYKKAREERELREMDKKEFTHLMNNEKNIIETKNRELSSNVLMLMVNNQSIQALSDFVTEEGANGKIDKQVSKQLLSKIHDMLQIQNDWEQFKLYFEQVHPDFFKILVRMYPDLTDNELRLCAYCKMNISNKQIAQLLSVQPQTVTIARYRMRKKMNLPKDVSLNEFLRDLA